MLNRLLRFKWWIATGLFCAVGVPFVAYQKHRAAEGYRDNRALYCAAFMHTEDQKITCQEEKATVDDYMDWRYKLFEWPEGITAWAVIATGFAIVWQAVETRKAAQATESAAKATSKQVRLARKTLILQFRPKLIVRGGRVDPNGTVGLLVTNIGGSKAYVLTSPIHFYTGEKENGFDVKTHAGDYTLIEDKVFLPGETKTIILTLSPAFSQALELQYQRRREVQGTKLTAVHIFAGGISYKDDLGTERMTMLHRIYSPTTGVFTARITAHNDYAD